MLHKGVELVQLLTILAEFAQANRIKRFAPVTCGNLRPYACLEACTDVC